MDDNFTAWPEYRFRFTSAGKKTKLTATCIYTNSELAIFGENPSEATEKLLQRLADNQGQSADLAEMILVFRGKINREKIKYEREKKIYCAAKKKHVASKAITEPEITVKKQACICCHISGALNRKNLCPDCAKRYYFSETLARKELYGVNSSDKDAQTIALISIAFSLDILAQGGGGR